MQSSEQDLLIAKRAGPNRDELARGEYDRLAVGLRLYLGKSDRAVIDGIGQALASPKVVSGEPSGLIR